MFGQLMSFGNLVHPFPIGIAAIFFFLQSHYIGMLRSQSSSFTNKIMGTITPTSTTDKQTN